MSRKFFILWFISLAVHLLWMVNVGFVLPYIPHFFLLPFLLYHRPVKTSHFLLLAFVTGLIVDAFSGTGGLYAAALLSFAALQKLYDRWTADPLREKIRPESQAGLLQRAVVFAVQVLVFEILFYFFDGMSVTYVFFRMGNVLTHAFETWLFLWLFTGLFIYKPILNY